MSRIEVLLLLSISNALLSAAYRKHFYDDMMTLKRSFQDSASCDGHSCSDLATIDDRSITNVSVMDSANFTYDAEPRPQTFELARVLKLLAVAAKSVGVVFVIACAGALLVYMGIMTQEVKKGVAGITMSIAMPCLLFTNILRCPPCPEKGECEPCALVATKLIESSVLFFSPFVIVTIGLVTGFLLALSLGISGDLRRLCVACVTFGNSTGMPIVLLSVTFHCLQVSSTESSIEDPLPFLATYLVIYPALQWTIASWLFDFRPPAEEETSETSDALSPKEKFQESFRRMRLDADNANGNLNVRAILREVLQPPVIAIIVAIIVGSTPAYGLFVDRTRRSDAVLHWVFSALKTIGRAAVPLNVIVLGSSLVEGPALNAVPLKLVLSISLCKLVAVPLVMFAIISIARHFFFLGLPSSIRNSIWFVISICTCTPTANNMLIIAISRGRDTRHIASTILVQYILAPFLVTGWLTVFLYTLE